MSMEGLDALIRRHIPDFDGVVPTTCDDFGVVELQTVDGISVPRKISSADFAVVPSFSQLIALFKDMKPVHGKVSLQRRRRRLPLLLVHPVSPYINVVTAIQCIDATRHRRKTHQGLSVQVGEDLDR
jgi:hypothetical protein